MNLYSLSFSQLIRFLELAKELHFTKTAEKLGIAQPLLSEQIKALEQTINVKLFNRTSRQVELTLAGEIFRDRAQLIIEGMKDSISAARAAERGEQNRLRIGYTDEYSSDFLPDCIQHIKELRPGANLELTMAMTPHLIELLRTGLIDGAFMCPIPDDPFGPEYTISLLPPLPLSVALPANHPLAARQALPVSALRGEPFIEGPPTPQSASERVVNRLFSYHGIQRHVIQRACDLELNLSLVAKGIGVMIGYFTEHSRRRKDLSIVALEESHATLTRALVWRNNQSVPLLADLLDFLNAYTSQHA